ncbi:MAG TPA: hypothetical protein VNZ49_06445 [Bacteroidia bacterium]|jgi:hypothetical protein|nr:hypothetical protein [Bacteroidia bacterium]
MARDFTLKKYHELLNAAIKAGYTLTSYEDFILNGKNYSKVFILRHDVDDLPNNSLQTAILENKLGAKGSYYFRVVKQSFDETVINKIKELGHEISYHYEDMALCNGDIEKAFAHFKAKLELFKKFYPVKTVCMHGSPLSKWDNRLLWKNYNYKDLGIIAEPYFDTDFKKVLYITDTGRKWNNATSSVRDKVDSGYNFTFNNTDDICRAFTQNKFPSQIMLNIHPQRWTDNYYFWGKELIVQNLKNIVKRILVSGKSAD